VTSNAAKYVTKAALNPIAKKTKKTLNEKQKNLVGTIGEVAAALPDEQGIFGVSEEKM
jgi:membrane protein implicated in regulation of membrane protease activity